MKHTFSRSFATRLSIYVLSFTLIVFTTIMVLAYNYSQEKVTNYAIERTHGLLNNMVTGNLQPVEFCKNNRQPIALDAGRRTESSRFTAPYHYGSGEEQPVHRWERHCLPTGLLQRQRKIFHALRRVPQREGWRD